MGNFYLCDKLINIAELLIEKWERNVQLNKWNVYILKLWFVCENQ